MSSWARVGVKCVCIKKGEWLSQRGRVAPHAPVYGEECEVSAVDIAPDGDTYLYLRGYTGHVRWAASRFRPLIAKTQEQDVALFKSLLTPAPELVE